MLGLVYRVLQPPLLDQSSLSLLVLKPQCHPAFQLEKKRRKQYLEIEF